MRLPILLFLVSIFLVLKVEAQLYRPFHDSVYVQYKVVEDDYPYRSNFTNLYSTFSHIDQDSVFTFLDQCENGNPYADVWPIGSEFIVSKTPGKYAFTNLGSDSIILYTNKPIGSSWVIRPLTGDVATYVDKLWWNFGNVSDSAMLIKYNADTIMISKHYGVCYLQCLYNISGGNTYKNTLSLVYASGTALQKPIFTPREIFNYNVGDCIYYQDDIYHYTYDQYHQSSVTYTRDFSKYKILSKTTVVDTIIYSIEGYHGIALETGPILLSLEVTPDKAIGDLFPNMSLLFSGVKCTSDFNGLINSSTTITVNDNDNSTDMDYFYYTAGEMDYFYETWYDTDHGFFEYTYGYLMNHDPIQTKRYIVKYDQSVTDPDDQFFGIVNSVTSVQNNNKQLFPIPCKDQLNIEGIFTAEQTEVEITTITGVTIMKESYGAAGNSISISTFGLLPGTYLLRIKTEKSAEVYRFVKE
jgi:hypothetical protein